MEIKENQISFKISEDDLNKLKLSLAILKKDPDEAFQEWISQMAFKALKLENNSISKKVAEINGPSDYLLDKLDNNVVRSRIARWARNKSGFAYKILNVFFEIYNSNENHYVKREDLKQRYIEKYLSDRGPSAISVFLITFRQMCSDSSHAYGLIFKYINSNNEDLVFLHPLNEEYILSLKNEFEK